jgi:basic amino acid/polyamine antiporter, APA family
MLPPMDTLRRRLGVGDAVVLGLGSMLGAGVFAAFSPAAAAAGDALMWSLCLAGGIAYCNAMSSARLAARYPESGGTYVYGRERLGAPWGFAAGWAFLVGKTASAAAMALTVATYVWPAAAVPVALATVAALTALNYRGIHKSALASRVIVAVVVGVLGLFTAACFIAPPAGGPQGAVGGSEPGLSGVLTGAGFLFFAFAGYARVATLGEEVREPERTIPRAIRLSLLLTLLVYGMVAAALLYALGAQWLSGRDAPLADAAALSGWPWSAPVVRVGAAVAATGSLLALILGISRTVLAMSRDGVLPHSLSAVHPAYRVPHHAEVAVGLVVGATVMLADLRQAIGFSSFCILVYYGIANLSAWTLGGRAARTTAVLGVLGCVVVAVMLPLSSVLTGLGILAAGAVVWAVAGGGADHGQATR